ncbi:MAG: DNA gyrase/topoisomerase IV subunit A, partial [Chitinophagaceae bacterium]
DLDQVIVFRKDGKMLVTKVAEKAFVGKDIIHVDIFRKNDDRTTYNLIYTDSGSGISYAKRFNVSGITRDKEYGLGKTEKTKFNYFSANPNGEAEMVTIILHPQSAAKKKNFDFDFSELEIKGRSSVGNQVTKYPIKQVKLKGKGISTLSGLKIWYDDAIGRLNIDQRGRFLGSFEGEDRILVFYSNGSYELTSFELTNRYVAEEVLLIEKFDPDQIVTAIYFDADKHQFQIKRFKIETQTKDNKFFFIKEGSRNYLKLVTTLPHPRVKLITGKKKSEARQRELDLTKLVDVMGWRAAGNKFCDEPLSSIDLIQEQKDMDGKAVQQKLF